MLRKGYIYLITNKINGKRYVGQTSRDIWTRFEEHCYDDRSTSAIHTAIKKYGVQNFSLELIEEVDLNKLDEREKFWIKHYNTCSKEGYNKTFGGTEINFNAYDSILIQENGFIVDSCEKLAEDISRLTDWSKGWLAHYLKEITDNPNKDFLGYHLVHIKRTRSEDQTDILDLENWIKTLNIKFQGQHIYCEQLDKHFETVGEAAKYFVDNGLYQGKSKMPIQSIITSIGYNINGKVNSVDCLGGLSFYRVPGTKKQEGSETPFTKKRIYCPELDKEFESGVEAANYFIDNKIWTGIKVKTAKLRISDVVRGVFPQYKGYTFKAV